MSIINIYIHHHLFHSHLRKVNALWPLYLIPAYLLDGLRKGHLTLHMVPRLGKVYLRLYLQLIFKYICPTVFLQGEIANKFIIDLLMLQ